MIFKQASQYVSSYDTATMTTFVMQGKALQAICHVTFFISTVLHGEGLQCLFVSHLQTALIFL